MRNFCGCHSHVFGANLQAVKLTSLLFCYELINLQFVWVTVVCGTSVAAIAMYLGLICRQWNWPVCCFCYELINLQLVWVTVVCGNVTVTCSCTALCNMLCFLLFVNCLYSFDVVLLELETGVVCQHKRRYWKRSVCQGTLNSALVCGVT